jgi:plastocyanin
MGQKGRLTVKAENDVLPARGKSVAVACAAVCVALALATAGCGSSGSTTTSTTTTTVTTQGTVTTKSKTTASSGLKAVTTPKYAAPASSEPVKSGVVQIAYRNITIDPDTVRAKVGSTIKWTNEDPQKCNVTSEGGSYKFASKDFGEGGSFELKLDKPGVIHYECTYYPTTMNGTIEAVG